MKIIELISQPWHWSVSGILIALTMTLMLYFGKQFSLSSTYRTLVAMGGAGKRISLFDFNWKDQIWNLLFAAGIVAGGYIAIMFLEDGQPVAIADSTATYLESLGVKVPRTMSDGSGYLPLELYGRNALNSLKGIAILILGGWLAGFGARWAGGSTSGHFVSGLSNLEIPSLITVIGFLGGGIIMTNFLLPILL